MSTHYSKGQLDTLAAKIKHIAFGMFTTSDAARVLTSRPLTQQQVDEEGQMWFFTSDEAEFTRHLQEYSQVNIGFSDIGNSVYVSVTGWAELIRDRKKAEELWNPMVKAWLPGGLDDSHLVLIKVKMQSAEYWDTHSSKMTQLFAIAKAAFTGERPTNIGEHAKIDMSQHPSQQQRQRL
ncbi:MAG TPA: pyridoxamine 5'-phosphate oxidase family protein [Janthinobacterium sp.]|nr:pyridoxamine 5'-phosphate oxidase family protein [Janthinobacterium sp.]